MSSTAECRPSTSSRAQVTGRPTGCPSRLKSERRTPVQALAGGLHREDTGSVPPSAVAVSADSRGSGTTGASRPRRRPGQPDVVTL
ncbi:hypothetical protein C1I97_03980 [Streptomyces sp. NTH33]|nr:hypothetical protein C1I97_03980 [Streptomyces sp. NTH33]